MKNNNVVEFKAKSNKVNNKENIDDDITINETENYEDCITYPTEREIKVMNAMIEKYTSADPDAMVPFNMWNGDCMHSIFDEMSNYAKEIQADPWDTFALFVQKLYGMKIIENEDGGVTVKYGKE